MSWRDEFNRRLASGADKRWMPGKAWMRGEWQVKDKLGNFFRANGKPCCGCAHNRNINNSKDTENNPPNSKPRW